MDIRKKSKGAPKRAGAVQGRCQPIDRALARLRLDLSLGHLPTKAALSALAWFCHHQAATWLFLEGHCPEGREWGLAAHCVGLSLSDMDARVQKDLLRLPTPANIHRRTRLKDVLGD